MRKVDVFPYYKRCVKSLSEVYTNIQNSFSADSFAELARIRGYVGDEQNKLIREMNLGYCEGILEEDLGDMKSDLGLVSSNNNFLLEGKFIIPVEGVSGDIISLIGYYPDIPSKKYITLPTPFFSKDCMFFNFKQAYELSFKEFGGLVFLVEGIFDCLSLRSIGLPCIATMGSNVSDTKKEILKVFRKVIAIPDNDNTGRRALNRRDKRYGWRVPDNTTMIRFDGGSVTIGYQTLKVKDMDNFVSWFEADDVREILLSFKDSREEIETLKL